MVCDKPVAQHLNEKTWNVDDIISAAFEVNDLEFLSPILWIMNQPQEIMTWDKKSGEIVYMQKRIRGSNIIKLLKTTCAEQMNALGIVQFCRGLIILNIPKKCIQNPKMKQTLESLLYVETTSSNYHSTPKYWKEKMLKILMDHEEEGNNKIDGEDEKFLKSLYYNVKQPTAFARKEILWKNIKLHDMNITRKQLQEWLSHQDVYTTHRGVI